MSHAHSTPPPPDDPTAGTARVAALELEVRQLRQKEAQLSSEAARWRQLFEQSQDGVVILDTGGKVVELNPSFADMLGYTLAEARELYVWDWMVEWTREEMLERMRQHGVLRSTFATRHRRKDGTCFPVEVSTHIVHHEGQILVCCSHRDITARKEAEAQLRASEVQASARSAQLRSVLESPRGIIVFSLDREYRYTMFTRSHHEIMKAIWGVAVEPGQNMLEAIGRKDDRQRARDNFDRALGGEHFMLIEEYGKHALCRRFWEDRYSPVYGEGGAIVGLTVFVVDVSSRVQAETALRANQQLLETAQAFGRIGSWVAVDGPEGRLEWSAETCRLFGLTPGEFDGESRTFLQLVHPEDREQVRRAGREATARGGPAELEYRILRPDGQLRWLYQRADTERDAAGRPLRKIGVVQDVTERKLMEAALCETQERYRVLVEESPAGIGIFQEDRLVFINSTGVAMLGATTKEQVLGRSGQQIIHPDDHASATERIRRRIAGEPGVYPAEVRYVRLDGTSFPVEVSAVRIRFEGQPAVQFIARDISDRKAAQAELSRQQEHFRRLIENASDLITTINYQGVIRYQSPSSRRELGYAPEELVGRSVFDFIHPDDVGPTAAIIEQGLASDEPSAQAEFRWRHRNGQWRTLQSIGRNLSDPTAEGLIVVNSRDITERKQAEQELKTQRDLDRVVLTTMGQGLTITDAQGRFEFVNPAFAKMADRPPQDLLGWRPEEVASPEERSLLTQHWARRQQGEASIYETRLVRADGSVTYALINAVPRWCEGKIAGSIAVITDLTERKLLQIQNEHERSVLELIARGGPLPDLLEGLVLSYETLFPGLQGSVLLLDPTGQHLRHGAAPHLPPAYCQAIDGLKIGPGAGSCGTAAYSGKTVTVADIAHDPLWRDFKDLALAHGLRACWSVPILGTSGRVLGTFAFYAHAPRAARPEELLAIARGAQLASLAIERKQAEEQLREQAALLDAANDAIYVSGLDHVVTYWNAGAERLYGWPRAEALGRKITEMGEGDEAASRTAHTLLLAEGHWSGELTRTSKKGRKLAVFCRWTLLRDAQGRPKEILAINTDITEKKHFETQFLRIQRMEGIGALAGGIAHDLNNILAPILMTGPLLRETLTDPEGHAMLGVVESCAQRGADIIKQLLTFARGKPGVRVALPVRPLLNEMNKFIRETFPRNILTNVHTAPDLWSVFGDATQIHQALMNLCVNARDAMPDGGSLTLTAENFSLDDAAAAAMPDTKAGDYVRLSVADRGMGIQPEDLERIFDPFFTTKEVGKGTGLGLATVLGIVRGHGGFVRVTSRPGEGTTFELAFPAVRAASAEPPVSPDCPSPRGAGELILVVEDEAAVRQMIQLLLENQGYRVVVTPEGQAGLAAFLQHQNEVKAVITDMMMAGMDGPTFIRELHKLRPHFPVIGMTGLTDSASLKGLEGLTISVMLAKPFPGSTLFDTLHRVLAGGDGDHGI